MDFYERSLKISEELGDKYGIGLSLHNIGIIYWYKGKYEKVEEYLMKSLVIQKEIGYKQLELSTITHLYLVNKFHNKAYDKSEIHRLIKEKEDKYGIVGRVYFSLYQLLEDKSYLETAYNQVQEKASAMDDGAKFLELKIPKAIVEEWEKVK